MSVIDDPQAIRFVNEVIRPLCEVIRNAKEQGSYLEDEWNKTLVDGTSTLSSLFPNDTTPVEDGRAAEGISRLNGADINAVVQIVLSLAATMNDTSQIDMMAIVRKPCVRPLRIAGRA